MAWATTRPSLLDRLRDAGDDAAWSEFDGRYGELIVRYARSRGLSLADAEDVRQIVLMNFARAAPGFTYTPTRGRFRSYLGKVVRTAMSRQQGRPDRRMALLENDVLATLSASEDDDGADELWEREWVRHHLRRAMQTVRCTYAPRSVEAFDLLLAGHTIREAAEAMGMTEEGVHKIKQRIRDRLRRLVAMQLAEEGDGDVV